MFRDQHIKFVTTTATAVARMKRPDALEKLSKLCMANANALLAALQFCAENGVGCFRINSQILPIKTHPTCGYSVGDLPEAEEIVRRFKECGKFVEKYKLRTCFHPDQFVVLNSPRVDVVEKIQVPVGQIPFPFPRGYTVRKDLRAIIPKMLLGRGFDDFLVRDHAWGVAKELYAISLALDTTSSVDGAIEKHLWGVSEL